MKKVTVSDVAEIMDGVGLFLIFATPIVGILGLLVYLIYLDMVALVTQGIMPEATFGILVLGLILSLPWTITWAWNKFIAKEETQ